MVRSAGQHRIRGAMARLFAAAAMVIGCSIVGVGPAAATTDAEIVPPLEIMAGEVPPTISEILAADTITESGGASDGAEASPTDEPTASPSPSPSPETVLQDPIPADEQGDPDAAPEATPSGTDAAADSTIDSPTAVESGAEKANGTSVVEPVPPAPAPSSMPAGEAAAAPAPSTMPHAAPIVEVAPDLTVVPPPDPDARPAPVSDIPPAPPSPKPAPTPALDDLEPSEDAPVALSGTGAAAPQPTFRGSTAQEAMTAPDDPSTSDTCESTPSADTAPSVAAGDSRMSPVIPPLNPSSSTLAWSLHGPIHPGAEADVGLMSAIEQTTAAGAGITALLGQRVSSVTVAVDFARSSSGWAGPLVFNVWLRRQLRERRMSQRQLGMLSGVNHSAISRLINGLASPTLETATKLVHALHMEWTDDQIATYFDLLPEHTLLPTQRVESALRGDGTLTDSEVRAIMHHYLMLRARRKRSGDAIGDPDRGSGSVGELPTASGDA